MTTLTQQLIKDGYAVTEEDALRMIDEQYIGEFESIEEYVYSILDDLYPDVPDSLKYYINVELLGRDIELEGSVITIELDKTVHVFSA